MDIYQKIKEVCQGCAISVSELERKIGVSTNSLCKWKTISPTVESLLKVADYFNVSLDYFVGRTVSQTLISNTNEMVSNENVGSDNVTNSNNFSPNDNQQLSEIEKSLLEGSKDLYAKQKIDVVNYARGLKK